MNRKKLASLTVAAMFAASAAVMADVTVNLDGSAFVGRGDVLSVFFTGPHAGEEMDAHAAEVTFQEEGSIYVEQDCYTTGANQTKVGVRTGKISSGLVDVTSSVRWNPNGNATGYFLDPPAFDFDEAEIDWDNSPPGDGCPGTSHPKFAPRFGPVTLDGIWATWGGQTVQIYPE